MDASARAHEHLVNKWIILMNAWAPARKFGDLRKRCALSVSRRRWRDVHNPNPAFVMRARGRFTAGAQTGFIRGVGVRPVRGRDSRRLEFARLKIG